MRRRLDSEIVRRGLAHDLEAAHGLIADRRVLVEGAPADKPGRLVEPGEAIKLLRADGRYVGRGGEKLEGAIRVLGIDLAGHVVLDAGASTGGFTDAVLQHGAASVLAVDVGRGQLHERLRQDPRVEIRDRTNIRVVDPVELGDFDSVVADLSFISLTAVMANMVRCTRPGGQLVLLVKPQFEVSSRDAGHNRGVIREPHLWSEALERTVFAGLRSGASVEGMCVSPITGADGNVEFFLHLRRDEPSDATHTGQSDLPEGALPAGVRDMISDVLQSVPTSDEPSRHAASESDDVGEKI